MGLIKEISAELQDFYELVSDTAYLEAYGLDLSVEDGEEFKRLLEALELPNVRWHDLRRTCATQLLLASISPKAVAKILVMRKRL